MSLRKSAVNISGDKIPLRRASPAALRSQLWPLPWGRGGDVAPHVGAGLSSCCAAVSPCRLVPTVAREDFMWHR